MVRWCKNYLAFYSLLLSGLLCVFCAFWALPCVFMYAVSDGDLSTPLWGISPHLKSVVRNTLARHSKRLSSKAPEGSMDLSTRKSVSSVQDIIAAVLLELNMSGESTTDRWIRGTVFYKLGDNRFVPVQACLDFSIAMYASTSNVIDELWVRFEELFVWFVCNQAPSQEALDGHIYDILSAEDELLLLGLQHPCQ